MPFSPKNAFKFFFLQRSSRECNQLPAGVVCMLSPSPAVFKEKVTTFIWPTIQTSLVNVYAFLSFFFKQFVWYLTRFTNLINKGKGKGRLILTSTWKVQPAPCWQTFQQVLTSPAFSFASARIPNCLYSSSTPAMLKYHAKKERTKEKLGILRVTRPQKMKVPGSRAFRLTFMFEDSSFPLT